MNSLIGERHPLADIDEFSGCLRAVKDAVAEHLLLVARIEALIAGHGLNDAILRAHAYADAGADAVFSLAKKYRGQRFFRSSPSRGPGFLS